VARVLWENEYPGVKVKGVIHVASIYPFNALYYTERQLNAFVSSCSKPDGGVLHIDATGSVIKKVDNQKTVYYYCGLMDDTNLPAFEFHTTCHTSGSITYLIETFNSHVRKITNGRSVRPRYVVCDQSFAIIIASLTAFMKTSIGEYLSTCYEILNGCMSRRSINERTYICLCCAHSMKAMSRRLVRVETSVKKRKTGMLLFAALQRTTTLQEASLVYKNIHIVLCSPIVTSSVQSSLDYLYEYVSGSATESEVATAMDQDETQVKNRPIDSEEEIVHDTDDTLMPLTQTARTLKERSPFTVFFNLCISDMELEVNENVTPSNDKYSPASFKAIQSQIHLYPLWSAALHSAVERFASDSSNPVDGDTGVACRNNGLIEAWFNNVKRTITKGTRLRPTAFIAEQLTRLKGRLNEIKLPQQMQKLKKTGQEYVSKRELWRRRKRTTYSSATTADKILRLNQMKRARSSDAHGSTEKEVFSLRTYLLLLF
jgi:hypothetical protein